MGFEKSRFTDLFTPCLKFLTASSITNCYFTCQKQYIFVHYTFRANTHKKNHDNARGTFRIENPMNGPVREKEENACDRGHYQEHNFLCLCRNGENG